MEHPLTTTAGFLAEYDTLERSELPPAQIAQVQVGLLLNWVFERPAELFAELRAHRPILVTAGPVVVARYQDVVEIANLDAVFGVERYEQAMRRYNGGPNFLIGTGDREEHDHDRALLQLAMRRSDADTLRASSARYAAEAVERALAAGRLDVTDAYARPVCARVMNHYYYGASGPGAENVMAWSRAMYRDIFFNFTDDAAVRSAGEASAQAYRRCLDELVAAFHAGAERESDTVLGRLIAQQQLPEGSFTDERIRDNLLGCTVGTMDNVAGAFANALDVLLDRPEQLDALAAAAAAGDDDRVLRTLLEALRFHPMASILVRFSRREETVARGTPYEQLIPAHRPVFASTGSAMMDEQQLDEPGAFDVDRPSHHHLHFGVGMHRCLGEQIAGIQLTELAKALVRLKELRRAPGPEGRASSTGGFPDPFYVEFGVAP